MSQVRKKLIEVSIPLEAINKASKKQKAPKGYPTAIHKYWAQRPIAACRGVLFAQLVDDPSAWPDRFPTEAEQDAERKRLHKVIEDMVPWEASNDEHILNAARWEIARTVAWGLGEEPPAKNDTIEILRYLQSKGPPIFDPFSGGGSIPLEAQRLGLRAYGSDLNPVAVLIGKALVEIPPRFSGQPPVNPKAQAEMTRGGHWNGKGAHGLAEDVRYYGQWMQDEAKKRIGHLYPKAELPDGSKATVIAWLWSRTVRSPDPLAKGAMVPLVSSFMLSTKPGKKVWVKIENDAVAKGGWRFALHSGVLSKDEEKKLKEGTIGRKNGGTCVLTGATMPFSYIREQARKDGFGIRLMAIVAEGAKGRIYLPADEGHAQTAASASPPWEPETLLAGKCRVNVSNYGLDTFADLFTARQLTALATLSDLVTDARALVLEDALLAERDADRTPLHEGGAGIAAYADAVSTYLSFAISRAADYGSTLSTWLTDDNAIRGTFGRQALPMTWDFCEGNFFGDSSAALSTILRTVPNVIQHQQGTGEAHIYQINAAKNGFPQKPCVINTDPPYFDNIDYADLSDYFYVWLRKSLAPIWPDIFRRLSTPKDEELVASAHRHGDRHAAEEFFMSGMADALAAMHGASVDDVPAVIYYAFKQSEAVAEGVTSSGWASFLQAIVNAGWTVDGTWPLRTESAGRLIGSGSNALASSIVLVCVKRNADANSITRADFVRLLNRELPEAIDDIRKAGVGPVDMQQSIIGPGMGVFSRNARVLEDDDSIMTVKTALAIINRVWGEIENEADAALDAETQVALAWFASYGFDAKLSGDLITLANAKNVPQQALFASGVFSDLRGRAQLTPRDQLSANWTPQGDRTLTVWECVQHAARTLRADDGGEEAVARLIAGMPPEIAADARKLSDRLFQIATDKGWAQEALIYNELSTDWQRLGELADNLAKAVAPNAPAQAALDLGGAA